MRVCLYASKYVCMCVPICVHAFAPVLGTLWTMTNNVRKCGYEYITGHQHKHMISCQYEHITSHMYKHQSPITNYQSPVTSTSTWPITRTSM